MKKCMSLLTVVFVILFTPYTQAAAQSLDEYQQLLSKYRGSIIYLDFWASWCGPCRKSFPWMNEMQQTYGNNKFKIISINLDNDHNLALDFLAKNPANFTILYDPEGVLAKEMKLKGMPSSFLINEHGKIVSRHVGFTEIKKQQYQQEITKLIKGLNNVNN